MKCIRDLSHELSVVLLDGYLPPECSELVAVSVWPVWAQETRARSSALTWLCQPANHVMFAEKKAELCSFFPFSGWVRPQQSTRGESIYRPIGRRNVKNAPGPESACGWGCWVFWGLRLADDQRLQNQAAPLFRYSLSLHVALTAAWSKPAMFRQISLLSIVVKIKLFINHVESNDTLNQMCWARITKCSLLTAHKNVWLMCMVKAFGSVKIDGFNKCKTFSDIE